MEVLTFFKGLGVAILTIALLLGLCYWIYVFMKKINPDFRFWFKYRVLRMKHNEEDVAMLYEDLEKGVSEEELFKAIILSNKASPVRARELIYIFKQLKKIKLKGGLENE